MKQIFIYSLAANWLFMLPAYSRLVTGRYVPAAPHLNTPEYGTYKKGLLEYKPFNCIYCMTFWLCLVATVFIPYVASFSLRLSYVPVTAPVVAYGIQKILRAIPTTLTSN